MSYQDTGIVENQVVDGLAAARAAAKLKRQKKAEAIVARQKGKENADEERKKSKEEHDALVVQEDEILQKKIANARKAMGVRKNDPNPRELYRLIEDWKIESLMRIWKR
jgi:hypothetical protein